MNIDEKKEKHPTYTTADHNPDECDECNRRAQLVRDFYIALGIPIIKHTTLAGGLSTNVKVQGYELYNILIDEAKLKVLLSKLHNKAFW